jgi:hypothetical protein
MDIRCSLHNKWRSGLITLVITKTACRDTLSLEIYTVGYELLKTAKIVYMPQDSIVKSERINRYSCSSRPQVKPSNSGGLYLALGCAAQFLLEIAKI